MRPILDARRSAYSITLIALLLEIILLKSNELFSFNSLSFLFLLCLCCLLLLHTEYTISRAILYKCVSALILLSIVKGTSNFIPLIGFILWILRFQESKTERIHINWGRTMLMTFIFICIYSVLQNRNSMLYNLTMLGLGMGGILVWFKRARYVYLTLIILSSIFILHLSQIDFMGISKLSIYILLLGIWNGLYGYSHNTCAGWELFPSKSEMD